VSRRGIVRGRNVSRERHASAAGDAAQRCEDESGNHREASYRKRAYDVEAEPYSRDKPWQGVTPGGRATDAYVNVNEGLGGGLAMRARILVVDDEPALGQTLKYLLEDNHDVTSVTSGTAALDLLLKKREEYDLVLCDLMMPQVSGMDVHQKLSVERPGFERRLVFMTGGAFTPRAIEFLARVPNARLDKPFTADAVEALLSHELTHVASGAPAH
jgi:CheY-like chemotaxis protein